ncbi:MAG: hypothetical protein ACKO14_05365 [Armatimonadota bacterium]
MVIIAPFTSVPLVAAISAPRSTGFLQQLTSGPQPGEKAPAFNVLLTDGSPVLREVEQKTSGAVTVVFLTAVERSAMPLVRILNWYGAERKAAMDTVIVVLPKDPVAMRDRLPAIVKSLNLKVKFSISSDGPDGPGAYAINSKAMMTLLTIKDGKVEGNLALAQPGIADAKSVITLMAKLSGDTKPPTPEELNERNAGASAARPAAQRPAAQKAAAEPDLSTPDAMKKVISDLVKEVAALKAELAALKAQGNNQPAGQPKPPAGPLPGAAPTDPGVLGLLRAFIQPSNTNADVDRVAGDIDLYTRGKADLIKQAHDGWVRILHLKYGTEYSQKIGAEMVKVWKTKLP